MMMMVVMVALTKVPHWYCPACFHPLIKEQLMSRSGQPHDDWGIEGWMRSVVDDKKGKESNQQFQLMIALLCG